MRIKFRKKSNKGYTLIEVMVTVAIFSLIFGMISGLFASALKAQRRSLASQELLAQTSYVMEYLSRHIRMAQRQDGLIACLGNNEHSYETTGRILKFVGNENDPCCWEISLEGEKLKRKLGICSGADPGSFLTSDDLVVEEFNINVQDSINEQPRVTIFLRVSGKGEKDEDRPVIEIQNTISQRNLNVK